MFQPVAGQIQFKNDTVMYQTVNGRSGSHGVFEDTFPFGEREITGDHHAAPFIAFCQEDTSKLMNSKTTSGGVQG